MASLPSEASDPEASLSRPSVRRLQAAAPLVAVSPSRIQIAPSQVPRAPLTGTGREGRRSRVSEVIPSPFPSPAINGTSPPLHPQQPPRVSQNPSPVVSPSAAMTDGRARLTLQGYVPVGTSSRPVLHHHAPRHQYVFSSHPIQSVPPVEVRPMGLHGLVGNRAASSHSAAPARTLAPVVSQNTRILAPSPLAPGRYYYPSSTVSIATAAPQRHWDGQTALRSGAVTRSDGSPYAPTFASALSIPHNNSPTAAGPLSRDPHTPLAGLSSIFSLLAASGPEVMDGAQRTVAVAERRFVDGRVVSHEATVELLQPEGVPPHVLEFLPVEEFETARALEGQSVCNVCQLDYEDTEVLRRLPCLHMFHRNCIDRWLVAHTDCPICRLSVLESLAILQRQVALLEAEAAVESATVLQEVPAVGVPEQVPEEHQPEVPEEHQPQVAEEHQPQVPEEHQPEVPEEHQPQQQQGVEEPRSVEEHEGVEEERAASGAAAMPSFLPIPSRQTADEFENGDAASTPSSTSLVLQASESRELGTSPVFSLASPISSVPMRLLEVDGSNRSMGQVERVGTPGSSISARSFLSSFTINPLTQPPAYLRSRLTASQLTLETTVAVSPTSSSSLSLVPHDSTPPVMTSGSPRSASSPSCHFCSPQPTLPRANSCPDASPFGAPEFLGGVAGPTVVEETTTVMCVAVDDDNASFQSAVSPVECPTRQQLPTPYPQEALAAVLPSSFPPTSPHPQDENMSPMSATSRLSALLETSSPPRTSPYEELPEDIHRLVVELSKSFRVELSSSRPPRVIPVPPEEWGEPPAEEVEEAMREWASIDWEAVQSQLEEQMRRRGRRRRIRRAREQE